MTRLKLAVSVFALLSLSACNDTDDDVVQAPAPGVERLRSA